MTPLTPFALERFFARYEFSTPYLLSPSDCESLHLSEVLEMADTESAALWGNLSLGYTESPGHPVLRQEIAGLYETIQPVDTLVAAPEECIFITMNTLLSPGDEVIVLHPAYQSLHEVARSLGCRVIDWSLARGGESAWRLDWQALEESLSPRTRLLVINFPHNPTGYLPGRGDLEKLVGIAREHSLVIFSDEMYRMLEYDPRDRLPAICDLYERGVSLAGVSKTLALPGLRIGWLATRILGLVDSLLGFKDYTTICSSAPSEILALIGLRNRDRILKRNLEIIRANLAAADQFFARHTELFTWLRPRAGSVAFPEWTGRGTVDEFCQAAIDREGVMLAPGSLFGGPENHFRLGFGRKNFAEGLLRVEHSLSTTL
ncbi:MAG: aminotransferase class I/II-fold pyridoxal phosphate-dependent enzyme [Chloroflexi bacterium]|nr:aminotransferase class I/II-fold pyridoxal phosphate-dependent enzyme [Chloroflexota bacterium]